MITDQRTKSKTPPARSLEPRASKVSVRAAVAGIEPASGRVPASQLPAHVVVRTRKKLDEVVRLGAYV